MRSTSFGSGGRKAGARRFLIFAMPAKLDIDTLVLALLSEEPAHGYDLVKRAERDNISVWANVSRSSVYQALKRLEEKGFVKPKEVRVGKAPPRTVYRITRSGKNALTRSLLRLMTEPLDFRTDFDIALLGIGLIPMEKVLEALDIHRAQTEHIAAEIEKICAADESIDRPYRLIYTRLNEQYRSHLKWLADVEATLKRG